MRSLRFLALALIAVIIIGTGGAGRVRASVVSQDVGTTTVSAVADTFVKDGADSGVSFGTQPFLEVKDGGDPQFDRISYIRFDMRGARTVTKAHLVLHVVALPNGTPAPLDVVAVADTNWQEATLTWNNKPTLGATLAHVSITQPGPFTLDITQAAQASGTLSLALRDATTARRMIRLSSRESGDGPALVLTGGMSGTPVQTTPTAIAATATRPATGATSSPRPSATATAPAGTTPSPRPSTTATAPAGATPSPRPSATATTSAGATATSVPQPPSTSDGGLWISRAALRALPQSGAAWQRVKAAADGSLGTPNLSDLNSMHDTTTLAVALVYGATNDASYRAKAASAILSAIGTEQGGRTLEVSRNLVSYIIAADIIDLHSYNPAGDARFRTWLAQVRNETLDGKTLIETHETRPNNWGTHAGASRVAIDRYIGDTADLARAAQVFEGWLGNRARYAGFTYGDTSWQCDSANPVGVNGPCMRDGHNLDGALPDDLRRGGSYHWPPAYTGYAWEGLQGATVQAELLERAGYPAWQWQNNALLRATQFLQRLNQEQGGWWATGDDTWQPWLINHAYGTSFPTEQANPGKNMAWTDWMYGQ